LASGESSVGKSTTKVGCTQRRLDQGLEPSFQSFRAGSLAVVDAARRRHPPETTDLGLGRHASLEDLRQPLEERQPAPRRLEFERCSPQGSVVEPAEPGQLDEHGLGELHEIGVVGVRLVELERRELGVVLRRESPSFRKLRLISYTRSKPPTTSRFR
jgi:hypothetical protein